MTEYEFEITEVNRNGLITWDAIDISSQRSFPINIEGHMVAGIFPEITKYLKDEKGVDFTVAYDDTRGDRLQGTTWTYRRGAVSIVVHDIPRTILRVAWDPS